MGTITTDRNGITTDDPGFTERARDFAHELAAKQDAVVLAQLLVDFESEDEEQLCLGLTPEEYRAALRAALCQRLMTEGVLALPGG